MSKQLSNQATKVWGLLTDPTTTTTYTQTLDITWKIIRETGSLLWLTFCLVLVGFDWFWTQSIGAGKTVRGWVNDIGKPSSDKAPVEAGKVIASVSKNSVSYMLSTARKQLGLPEKEIPAPVEKPVAIAPTPVLPAPVVEPEPTPVTVPTPAVEDTEPAVVVDAASPSESAP